MLIKKLQLLRIIGLKKKTKKKPVELKVCNRRDCKTHSNKFEALIA